MYRAAVAAFAVLFIAAEAQAQRIAGTVLRPDSATPVPQVLIEWRASRGAVQRLLTDARGRFTIALSRPDSVYLRILRPGYRPQVVAPLYVDVATLLSPRIVLSDQSVVLGSIRVEGASACRGRSDAAAWTLLEQARTAILAATIAARDPALHIAAVEYEGDATPAGAIVLRDSSVQRAAPVGPPNPAQRDSIFRYGYVRRTSDTSYYLAPTPDVIIDDRFRERYCATLVSADSSPPGLLGVRFQPARRPGPGIADVSGTFWLDDDKYLLSRVEFTYHNVPVHHRVDGLGGYLEFAVLPTGHWLLREWLFRMPRLRPSPVRVWARGHIVFDVSVNGTAIYSDSSAAALMQRAIPRRR